MNLSAEPWNGIKAAEDDDFIKVSTDIIVKMWKSTLESIEKTPQWQHDVLV